ncbi:hypothetical protein Francci3_1850 [Frankia casuarinae]|jgi:hypothetical protein|uniref:Uncharacterized protein n=1 Tax=Frankia casuarinae (strain DSM 45818 / CECT 9043 / HFP020203 / CcI3) TaxID=106370 RepID=Q2JBW6_FRACC|nr:hypothetical protein Francci3_1850 [Frankia casuarinae]
MISLVVALTNATRNSRLPPRAACIPRRAANPVHRGRPISHKNHQDAFEHDNEQHNAQQRAGVLESTLEMAYRRPVLVCRGPDAVDFRDDPRRSWARCPRPRSRAHRDHDALAVNAGSAPVRRSHGRLGHTVEVAGDAFDLGVDVGA